MRSEHKSSVANYLEPFWNSIPSTSLGFGAAESSHARGGIVLLDLPNLWRTEYRILGRPPLGNEQLDAKKFRWMMRTAYGVSIFVDSYFEKPFSPRKALNAYFRHCRWTIKA